MGSHFRFGNHWFPRFRTKVTYLENHSFRIRDESSSELEVIPVNPASLKEVFSYLENILVLGQQQSWSSDWMPQQPKPEPEEAKKKDVLPVGTPVCALDRHDRWYLGKISAHISSNNCYIIKWDNTRFSNETVPANKVVLRLQQPIQEPEELVDQTVLVDLGFETTRLEKVKISSLIENKTSGQLLYMAPGNQVIMPENVRGILLP